MNAMALKKDEVFADKDGWSYENFEFDKRVVDVFDDMVSRSVPGYPTIQLLVADLALNFERGGYIYDLGCSTGNTIEAIVKRSNKSVKIVGIDNSEEMLKNCTEKFKNKEMYSKHQISLRFDDITKESIYSDGKADIVILNLVMQFVRPLNRKSILEAARGNMNEGGCLIMVEKTIQPEKEVNEYFIKYYHEYKKEMGYSELEISLKREALENRLIPFYSSENIAMLCEAGFKNVTTFFQWMNFSGFVGWV